MAEMKPYWKDAPDWANWLCMDANGEWWWFENKPIIDYIEWDNTIGNAGKTERASIEFLDWKATLEKRNETLNQDFEHLLKNEMNYEVVRRKVGLLKRSLPQMEDTAISKMHDVNYWTCNCGSEYGDWEATQIVKCNACGRDKCPACDKQHGFHKLNRDRFGLCFKEVK